MNLKKLVLGISLAAFLSAPVMAANNSNTTGFISQYKAKNYLGCIQTTDRILKKDPSNAYAQYYQGLAYVQIGKKDKAIEAFNKVVTMNTNEDIVNTAKKSVACMTTPDLCGQASEQLDDFDQFIRSNKFYTEKVQSEINQKKLDKIRQDMNEASTQKSELPTNEEIANAVKTLAKVGFNPMNGMNMMQSPEMMQMNMLLGDNSSNNNNMLPYLLMSQNQNGASKISPELVQTMMMSQMQMY